MLTGQGRGLFLCLMVLSFWIASAEAQLTVSYHDRTGSNHQQQWDSLKDQGYRLLSLSIYDDPSDPRYAAVWVHRSGPAFAGAHGITSGQFQTLFDDLTPNGYVPIIISACGSGSSARFACYFERRNVPFLARHAATQQQFNDDNTWAKETGSFWSGATSMARLRPRATRVYGCRTPAMWRGTMDPTTPRPTTSGGSMPVLPDGFGRMVYRSPPSNGMCRSGMTTRSGRGSRVTT